jgi:glyoxylase-like metal-dependent hydrolase (beta-lactamase superfamily II)
MNKFIKMSIVGLVFSVSLQASYYKLKSVEITKDIHCVIGDFHPPMSSNLGFVSNMCFVDMGDSLTVLDAGPTYVFAQEFYELMKAKYPNKKVSNVVLSNYHDDRIGGAYFFKLLGANIIGHKTINDEIKHHKDKYTRMQLFMSKEFLEKTTIIPATLLVDGGYSIKGTKKSLEILKLSKVSEELSDIAIYSKDDSFVFTGNIIFNGRHLNYTKNSNMNGWIEALENIEKLDAKYVMGGHGKEYDKDSYKFSLEYLRVLRKGVKKALEDDLEDDDIINSIDVTKFNHLNHFKQLNYNNINNYVQQLEFED